MTSDPSRNAADKAALVNSGERFKNRRHALDWLKAEGHRVSQGKFYGDCAAGFPAVHKDGSVSRWQVMQYAQRLNPARRAAVDPAGQDDMNELAKQKLQADIDWRRQQSEREAHRLAVEQGKYLLRDEVEIMLAARAAILDADFEHLAYTKAPEIVALVGGDQARAGVLIDFLLTARDEWLNRYATTKEFVVEFPATNAEEGDGQHDR